VSTQVSATEHGALGLGRDDLLAMYRVMITARLLDEAALRQNRMGRAPFVVPAEGHEACQVGTAWPMRKGTDVWLPYYRDLAVVLTAGMTPYEVFLGVFAKAEDPSSGGRQMPSHWGHARLGIISGSSPIATQLPHAAGIAYAARYRGEDVVVGCWFGDGATSEGDWHEGINFAGVHKLPVIFVCENNHYAISVPQSKQMAIEDVADRARGYGFPGIVVDGNDVLACYSAMKTAHERARAGDGPTLIECKTYRFLGHTSDDDDKTYRRRDEVEEARHRDPLQVFGEYLRTHDVLDDVGAEAMRSEVKGEIDVAIADAWSAADPEPGSALRHVFEEPAPRSGDEAP
jgi:2-oxoisovalerate dehydrogenase E1 component alpha subunit